MATRATRSQSRAGPAACSTSGRAAAADAPPPQNPTATAPGLSTNPKRSAEGVTAPGSASGGGGGKRRRTAASLGGAAEPADDATVLTQRIAAPEATVASQGRRIAELEAENATLRKRPRLPTPPAALKQLVGVLGRHEPDLRDMLFGLVCMPRYLARCAAELPEIGRASCRERV